MLDRIQRAARFMPLFMKLMEIRVTGKRVPVRLDLNVTKRCNLRCKYCYVDFDELHSVDEFSLDRIKRTISDWHAMGTRWMRIVGGEPLIREDLGEIVSYAQSKGIVCELNTNGFRFEKRLDALRKIDSIAISIDGNEATHDATRGKGSYKIAYRALEVGKEAGLPVRIHGVLTRQSRHGLRDFAELGKKFDVPFSMSLYMSSPVLQEGRYGEEDELEMSNDEVVEFYREYRTLKEQGYPVANSFTAIDGMLGWKYGDQRLIKYGDFGLTERNCDLGQYSLFIDADGRGYACASTWKTGLNYFEVGAEETWAYLGEKLDCIECGVCPRDFRGILELDPLIIKEHVERLFSRGY